MKLWVDDLRTPPLYDWVWSFTSQEAIDFLVWLKDKDIWPFEAISLDHDLGGDDTTRRIVVWMIENDYWPEKVCVHTANPIGREWLEGTINRYGPGVSTCR